MSVFLVILYVLVCLFLILVVLLQQGKGADLAGAFGGGGSQAAVGPRSTANIMHRMTTASFVLFVLLSLALAILSGKARSSVMEGVASAPVGSANTATEPVIEPANDDAQLPDVEIPATGLEAVDGDPAAATTDAPVESVVEEPAPTE